MAHQLDRMLAARPTLNSFRLGDDFFMASDLTQWYNLLPVVSISFARELRKGTYVYPEEHWQLGTFLQPLWPPNLGRKVQDII